MMSKQSFLTKYGCSEDLIGAGAFSNIFLCKTHNGKYAAKIIKADVAANYEIDIEKEYKVLQLTNHRNIIKLYDFYFEKPHTLILITEYIEGKSMKEIISKKAENKLFPSEYNTKVVIGNLLRALEYLHSKDIVHRDVHSGNIFVHLGPNYEMRRIILGDFGLADIGKTFRNEEMYNFAPEMLNQHEYDHKVDVYAAGMNMKQYLSDLQFISPEAIDLMRRMLNLNPQHRISANVSLRHSWLNSNK